MVSGPVHLGDKRRIPTLDGWRGIAILMVLSDHAIFAIFDRYPLPWVKTGCHGVTLFFVLSGFLITSNLLAEPISLRNFYIRRFFRIMPTAWAFLMVCMMLSVVGLHWTSWEEIRGCLLFYRNFQTVNGIAGHFWTLSIEEQFYLIWPLLLVLFGIRRCGYIAAFGAVSTAVFRFEFWHRYEQWPMWSHTEIRTDALLIGCLLAILLDHSNMRERITKWSRVVWIPAGMLFLTAIATCHSLQPLWESAAIASLLGFTSLHPNAVLSRVLQWRPLTWIGTVSYTLYVWQEPFTAFHGQYFFLMSSVFLPPIVLLSHCFIEIPFRKLGRQLAEIPSRPSIAPVLVKE